MAWWRGGVVAELNGAPVAGGAAGAVTGEVAAITISKLYFGKPPSKLNESEREQLSGMSTVASALAGALASGSVQGTVAGAQAGKNAVENNTEGWTLPKGMADYGQSSSTLAATLEQDGKSPMEISSALETNVRGSLPEGQQPATGLVKAWGTGASVLGGEIIAPAAGATAVIGGGLLGGATDATRQLLTLKPGEKYSVTDTLIAVGESALTQGKGLIFSSLVNTGGAYLGSKAKGEDPTVPMVGNAIGTLIGNKAGDKFTREMLSKGYSPVTSEVIGTVSGGAIGTAIDFGIEESQKKGYSNEK
ncbi:VENN motif pre-toxin domain-containing protein [Salmonella enterica]|nr:VENN motif pre-toxin domain-containing protein [Salmonella enterica]